MMIVSELGGLSDKQRDEARRLVSALKATAESYHAGALSHEEMDRENRRVWALVKSSGLGAAVAGLLRSAEDYERARAAGVLL